MAQIIPFDTSVPHQSLALELGGYQTIVELRWNQRDVSESSPSGAWYLDILEIDATPILKSVKLVIGVKLGPRSTHPLLRNRAILVIPLTDYGDEIGFDDIGTKVNVSYFTELDLQLGNLPDFVKPIE